MAGGADLRRRRRAARPLHGSVAGNGISLFQRMDFHVIRTSAAGDERLVPDAGSLALAAPARMLLAAALTSVGALVAWPLPGRSALALGPRPGGG